MTKLSKKELIKKDPNQQGKQDWKTIMFELSILHNPG